MTDFIKIGFVGKAIGLKGYFRVNFITDCLENIKDLKNIFLQKTGKEMSSFEIEDVRIDKPDVIKLNGINNRNEVENIGCDEALFKTVVKTSFNQRRKTLRNSLKPILGKENNVYALPIFDYRPEQLNVSSFVELTNLVAQSMPAKS